MKFYNRFDIILTSCVYICVCSSIFILYSQEIILENSSERWFRQVIFASIGTLLLFALQSLNYNLLGNYAFPLYLFSLFLLLITLIPGIGSEINGARSWIRIGDVGFQTSELAKLSTIILLVTYLNLKEREMHLLSTLVFSFVIVIIPILLIVVQPDLGSAFSLMPILLALLIVAGADYYHVLSIMLYCAIAFLIPLYIEYHNITLLPNLLNYLIELQKVDVVPAVRILQSHIWSFIYDSKILIQVAEQDKNYLLRILETESLMNTLRDAADTIRYEGNGFLLLILEKTRLLIIFGAILSCISFALLIFRFARGVSYINLRKVYIPLGIVGISLVSAGIFQSAFSFRPHQVARITAFVNPDKFQRDLAYQIRASKAAIGSGQFAGRGFWKGEMTIGRYPLVPEAHTDFIFTAWSERTGFIGAIFLLLFLFAIPLRALLIASEAKDRFASLLASGLGFLFLFHITTNIGIGLGLLPVTGLPLTFLSYGGSHMVVSLGAIGILLSIYKRKFTN